MFRRGLMDGALSFMLEADNDPYKADRYSGSTKKYERDAFFMGYEIGYSEKYAEAYQKKRSLIDLAVDGRDVEPEGWCIFKTIEGTFVEETE